MKLNKTLLGPFESVVVAALYPVYLADHWVRTTNGA